MQFIFTLDAVGYFQGHLFIQVGYSNVRNLYYSSVAHLDSLLMMLTLNLDIGIKEQNFKSGF
jgi:hypothetical protein